MKKIKPYGHKVTLKPFNHIHIHYDMVEGNQKFIATLFIDIHSVTLGEICRKGYYEYL